MAIGAGAKGEGPITAINVTPLVDVCLVLVIIFMAVAPMAVTLGIKVLESRASTAEGKASAEENVNVKSKDKTVIVSADAKNHVGQVVEVLDASKQAGALKLAVMKAEGGS